MQQCFELWPADVRLKNCITCSHRGRLSWTEKLTLTGDSLNSFGRFISFMRHDKFVPTDTV